MTAQIAHKANTTVTPILMVTPHLFLDYLIAIQLPQRIPQLCSKIGTR